MPLAIVFAAIISVIHFFSEQLNKITSPFFTQISSFSAGVGISYLFLQLLPEFIVGATNKLFFVSILSGFVLWHVVEKYIYKTAPRQKIFKVLALEDSIISFVYHFILGIVLVDIASKGNAEAFLFFIPVALYTALSTLPVDASRNVFVSVFLASATFAGAMAANTFFIEYTLFKLMLGFVIGTMMFTIIRHSLPSGKAGEPFYFILGVLLYGSLILFI